MKNTISGLFLIISIFSCQSKDNKSDIHLSDIQRDSLLTNIVTYIYTLAPNATSETKFDAQFRNFYAKNSSKFILENLQKAPDGWTYFFVIRPVSSSSFRRGVLGKFKLKEHSTTPTAFEEIANTPHLKEEVVRERGIYLFQELVKKGNLNEQIPMKHYVEWPDEHLAYDKNLHEWKVVKPY